MYSNQIMERFQNPKYAGGLRGANGTGKAGEEGSDIVKIYLLVNEEGVVETAKFKAYGNVCTIVACDIACEKLVGKDLENALSLTSNDLLDELGQVPANRESSAVLAEDAIKNAVEDYYKKKEKEEKKNA